MINFHIDGNFVRLSPQEAAQLIGITPNEVEVTNLNSPLPSCVDMSKKKKKLGET